MTTYPSGRTTNLFFNAKSPGFAVTFFLLVRQVPFL
jgi:hypothetical protein